MDMMPEPQLEVDVDGTQQWILKDGLTYCLHRSNGPARIYPDGTQHWYWRGRLHRLEGPAVSNPDGSQRWYKMMKLHRLDGPAVIRSDGNQEWYVEGDHITDQVVTWMQQKGVTWPWDAHTQAEFVLTWT